MSDPLGQRQSFTAERQALFGIPEQPLGLRTEGTGTHARVMPAIELMKGSVPLGIIESAPHLTVLARHRRFAEEQRGCPGTVVGLQTQFIVLVVCGELLQPAR